MSGLKILYLGSMRHSAGGRMSALSRLGHQVTAFDPYDELPFRRFLDVLAYHTGGLGLCALVRNGLLKKIGKAKFDICLVNNGELLDRETVKLLRSICGRVVNYNQDNPFSPRDGGRWRAFLKALPEYDLFVTVRESNVEPASKTGARRVFRSWLSADEIAHAPIEMTADERAHFTSEVSFVGTWMPERGPFMATLIEAGIPLRIYGPRWHKCPEFRQLEHAISDVNTDGRNYNCAIAGSRISLALLSIGNEDLHTSRSLEIPAIGGLLCGQRTSEHAMLYLEGREALFWDNANECARVCREYLEKPEEAERIRRAGHARALVNNHFNEAAMQRILTEAMAIT